MRALMCPPDFIRCEKEINAWMDKRNPPDKKRAHIEWQNLVSRYTQLGLELWFIESKPEYQDMCFAANAGWCRWGKLMLGNFVGKMARARLGEVALYQQWFEKRRDQFPDIEIIPWPNTRYGFVGQGDVVTVGAKKEQAVMLVGYGQERTDYEAHAILRELHGLVSHQMAPIRLIDSNLYDLDLMCFYIPPANSLPQTLIWYPPATDRTGQLRISSLIEKHDQIILTTEEAYQFCCNAVFVQQNEQTTILMHKPSPTLFTKLRERGYHVIEQPTHEFLKNGGSIRCLTLFLPEEKEV